MNPIAIEVTRREETGRKSTQALRKDEQIPCVLYGGDENLHFYAPYNSFLGILFTPEFVKVLIKLDGKEYEAVIKDVQFHPVTDRVMHIDFLMLVPGKKFITEIPVRTEGLAPGVRNGGKLMIKMRRLKVKIAPEDLSPYLSVDISKLRLGKSIKVGELNFDNIEIMNSPSNPVVTVNVPRLAKMVEEDDEEEGEEAEEGAEAATEEAAAE